MTTKERYSFVIDYFLKNNPTPQTELNYNSPFELLVAVVLSAQCTDKRVNLVTPALFTKYKSSKELAAANFEDIFYLIKSISYPNNKAKHLIGLSQKIEKDFNGSIPNTIEDLQTLPGVGRKTANVIVSVLFNQAAMAVDTHVFRVSARIGLTKQAKTPLACEQQLTKHIPQNYIAIAHHWLILHGRYVCLARQPKCNECPFTTCCLFYKRINQSKLSSM